jgi:uroporphyrinogen decarboxylase
VPISNKPLINALNGLPLKQPPVWLMRQAGRYLPEYREIRKDAGTFLDLCYTPDLAAEVTLQPIRRYGFDAAIIFSDILVIPDALGQPVSFKEGVGPVLDAIRTVDELASLNQDRLSEHLNPVYEALQKVRKDLSNETALIGFAGAPWTVATYMVEGGTSRDFANTKRWAFSAPQEFGKLIDILVTSITNHLIAQVDAGADALQIFDSWAGMLPETAFDQWCVDPISRIVSGVKEKKPDVPIIVFPRLAGHRYLKVAAIEGISAVSLDQTVSLDWVQENLQNLVTVQGNLDPIYLLAGGDAMRAEVNRILESLSGGPFIFNLGHGVLPPTPLDNVAELCEIVSGWQG